MKKALPGLVGRNRWLISTLVVGTALSGYSYAKIDEQAMRLLDNMAHALRTETYTGTFVQVNSNHIETFRIEHSYDHNHGERERMVQLNGEMRQVYRDKNEVTCIWAGSKSVIVSDSKPREIVPKIDNQILDGDVYDIKIAGQDRIADRAVTVVDILPKDGYRYGNRLWIDDESGILLRRILMDEQGATLDELMFVEIHYPESLEINAIDDHNFPQGYRKVDMRPGSQGAGSAATLSFDALPQGYAKISETYSEQQINNTSMVHAVLSDGLASVSIYVQYLEQHPADLEGASMMGALTALDYSTEKAVVTLVGEVPLAALEKIRQALRLNQ